MNECISPSLPPQSEITAVTAGPLSAMLALLSPTDTLSMQELGTVLDLAELLVGAGPANTQVRENAACSNLSIWFHTGET